MNYIMLFLRLCLLAYLMYVYHETYAEHHQNENALINRYAIGTLVGCVSLLLCPKAYFIHLHVLFLILMPLYVYWKKEEFMSQYVMYGTSLLFAIGCTIFIHYIITIIPVLTGLDGFYLDYVFINTFIITLISILQIKKRICVAPYVVLTIIGNIGVLFYNIMYYNKQQMVIDHSIQIIPMLLTFCFIAYFRLFYIMQVNTDNVLKLTVQRYTEKENQAKYETMEKENRQILQQMHDMKKHLRLLDEIQDHQEEFQLFRQKVEQRADDVLNLKQTGNPFLDRILQTYHQKFQIAKIQCNIEVDDIDFSFMDIVDCSALFANLLDNAMESCVKCEDRVLLLRIRKQNNYLIIKMKNSCCDIVESEGDLQTTKNESHFHGFGMHNIQLIAKKYAGEVRYRYDIQYQLFITTICLKYDRL